MPGRRLRFLREVLGGVGILLFLAQGGSLGAGGPEAGIEAFVAAAERAFATVEGTRPGLVVPDFVPPSGEAAQLFSEVRTALIRRFLERGRVRVVDEDVARTTVQSASKGLGEILSVTGLKRLADELDVQGVVVGSPGPTANTLRLRAIATRDGALLAIEEIPLGPPPRPAKGAEQALRPRAPGVDVLPPRAGGAVPLDSAIVSLDLGDTDGDGREEILFTDGEAIWRLPLGQNPPAPEKIYAPKGRGAIIHLGVGDVNGNGRAEIFVTHHGGRAVRSLVLEHDGTAYRELSGVLPVSDAFLHLAGDWDGDGVVDLFWQRSGFSDPFMGSIRRAIWKDGRYVEAQFPKLPEHISLYDFAVFDWDGDGQPEYLVVDRHRRPSLYSHDGRLLARATQQFEATPIRIYPQNEAGEYVFKGSKVLAVDLDGDGRREIVMVRNVLSFGRVGLLALTNLFRFENGQVCVLSVQEKILELTGCTPMLGGYVGDLAVSPRGELVLGVVEQGERGGWFGGPKRRSTLRVLPLTTAISRRSD